MVCYCLSFHRGFSFWPFLLAISTKLLSAFPLTNSPSTSHALPSHFDFFLVGGSKENKSFPVESCQILFWNRNEKLGVWNLLQIQLRLQEELVVWLNGLRFISSLLRSHYNLLLIFLSISGLCSFLRSLTLLSFYDIIQFLNASSNSYSFSHPFSLSLCPRHNFLFVLCSHFTLFLL